MKTEQHTLVILSPGFPKDEADTTCLTSQQSLVRALNKKFPSIQIIILSFQYPFTGSEYTWYGNRVTPFSGKNKGGLFHLLLWRRVWKKLKLIHKENKVIGLISFWCGECALLGNRFAKKYNLKHYCWILGQDAKKENTYVKRIKPLGSELIAMSDFLAEDFLANHSIRPAMVIPNGIDSGKFIKTDGERDVDILGVGSLIPLKQFEVFISTVKEIQKYFPAIKAIICGAGSEEHKLKTLVADYGLENNLSLTGELPHHGVLQLMQQSKILLHTSNYEGFSTVCLEALYAGCHVISFVQPMKNDIESWQIVKDKEDMLQKSIEILRANSVPHNPVLPYLIEDNAIAVMKLFGYQG